MTDRDASLARSNEFKETQAEPGAIVPDAKIGNTSPGEELLGRVFPTVKWGMWSLGLLFGLGRGLSNLSGKTDTPSYLGALSEFFAYLLFFGGLGWVAGHLARTAAQVLSSWTHRSDARTAREEHLLQLLERIAKGLEAGGGALSGGTPPRSAPDDEVRKAIREGLWQEAEERFRSFASESPEDPRVPALARELEQARESAAESLRAKVVAAREVNDTTRVLELHDALMPLLAPEPKRLWDQELARWFMGLIQKRLRAGTVRPDVAELSAQVAARFDTTSEGASLRAALPTLRRSAGLCARCGEPYTGLSDACPKCLGKPEPEEPEDEVEPQVSEFPFGEV